MPPRLAVPAAGMTRRQFGRFAALGLATGAGMIATVAPATAQTAADYYAQARELAGDNPVLLALIAALTKGYSPPRPAAPAPQKIFDDLAVLSVGSVSCLAILTSGGIVLIDALNSAAEAESVIAGGLSSLGADPATIKYVVVTHGHGDHYGGAQYLAGRYGARVLMAPADWNLIAGVPGAPARDLDITNGQRLTLGATTIQLCYTPGHTPGTVSPIFPVTWEGTRHMAMSWGGTNPPAALVSLRTYLTSVLSFRNRTRRAGVDVEVSTHPFVDYGLERMQQLRTQPRGANPFVLGQAGMDTYMAVMEAMLRGRLADAAGTTAAAAEAVAGDSCC
ncbi:MBL fold metallo-hydrolase [Nonomuraea harbinensis]|uniref:MBL fold metallo-hydrolase n=1 Tax=Nonomuraea harbinensis TaxID=1286938 RepID=A0ABW1BLE1_9ACTN|nr:MBL fold metallo-hydrolase [Nonomuraea harbinensis]